MQQGLTKNQLLEILEGWNHMVDLDISEDRIRPNIDIFLERLNKRDGND